MIATVPSFAIALPELVLTGITLVLLMVGTFGKEKSMGLVSALTVVGFAVTASWC